MGQVDQNSKYGERKTVFLKYANRNVLNFSLCTLFYCDIVDCLLNLNFENIWLLIQSICLRFEYHINFHWKFCKICTSTIQRSYLSSLGIQVSVSFNWFSLNLYSKKNSCCSQAVVKILVITIDWVLRNYDF